ncbi:uncharacterized protein LOC144579763 [Callithrix jacchus]
MTESTNASEEPRPAAPRLCLHRPQLAARRRTGLRCARRRHPSPLGREKRGPPTSWVRVARPAQSPRQHKPSKPTAPDRRSTPPLASRPGIARQAPFVSTPRGWGGGRGGARPGARLGLVPATELGAQRHCAPRPPLPRGQQGPSSPKRTGLLLIYTSPGIDFFVSVRWESSAPSPYGHLLDREQSIIYWKRLLPTALLFKTCDPICMTLFLGSAVCCTALFIPMLIHTMVNSQGEMKHRNKGQ